VGKKKTRGTRNWVFNGGSEEEVTGDESRPSIQMPLAEVKKAVWEFSSSLLGPQKETAKLNDPYESLAWKPFAFNAVLEL
jgi:hypothetical protein